MSETEPEVKALPAPEPAPVPVQQPVVVVRPRRSVWPVVFALGFLVLAGGEGFIWYNVQAHRADATELAVLRAQMDDVRATQARTAPAADSLTAQADLAQKYVVLAAQLAAVQAQAAADHGALSVMQTNAQDLGKLTQQMTLLNALGTARLALDAGQPLGQIPNAPPELAQFATVAPPVEAQLRGSFEDAARKASEASLTANGEIGVWTRTKLRLEGIITISDGSRVIFGPPAAKALNTARRALDNGDLAGAVAALQGMSPPAQAAMADWLSQAQALLAARAALVTMARGS
jgi:hypothetical protein